MEQPEIRKLLAERLKSNSRITAEDLDWAESFYWRLRAIKMRGRLAEHEDCLRVTLLACDWRATGEHATLETLEGIVNRAYRETRENIARLN
jgi:hypothetical protein